MIHISLSAETIAEVAGFPLTNTLLMAWVTMALLVGIGFFATRHLRAVPCGLQNALECIIEGMLSFVRQVTGDPKKALQFFPPVATIFLFVLVSNWLGILPGVGTIGFFGLRPEEENLTPLLRSSYSGINMTLALAIVAVLFSQAFGIAAVGFFRHAGRYISFKGPIEFFVGILELFSEIAKVISFSFRLFGNIFAGEVLLVTIAFLVPFIAPLPFLALEIFVGFIQALIFAALALVFFTIATVEHY